MIILLKWRKTSRISDGKDNKIVDGLKDKMQKASDMMEFERAAEYRDLLQAISTLRTKQRMNQDMMDRDIFGYMSTRLDVCRSSLFAKENLST